MNREEEVPKRSDIAKLRKKVKEKNKGKGQGKGQEKKDERHVLTTDDVKAEFPHLDNETIQLLIDDETSYEKLGKRRIVRYV